MQATAELLGVRPPAALISQKLLLSAVAGIALYALGKSLDVVLATLFFESNWPYVRAVRVPVFLSTLLLSGLLFPFIEEYVFRRKVFDFFLPRIGYGWAVVISVSICTAMHFEDLGRLTMVNIVIGAVLFQFIANISGTILMSWTCHAVNNLVVLSPKPSVTEIQSMLGLQSLSVVWFAGLVALLGAAVACLVLWRLSLLRYQPASS